MTPADPARAPARVSVVVCTHSERRLPLVFAGLESLGSQSTAPHEILVVVDHAPRLLHLLQQGVADRGIPGVRVLANGEAPGLSGARNTGLAAAVGDLVAFVDDDAVAEPDWIARLVAAHGAPDVIAVGGAVVPDAPPPAWFPAEFGWVVGCSYRGLPQRPAPVRNVIGCNMSFRREAFADGLSFDSRLGRTATGAAGCEETELCIRLSRARPEMRILYDPSARVRHRVEPDRYRRRYFLERCHAEGISKAAVTRAVGRGPALAAERRYVTRTLPSGVAAGVRAAVGGRDANGAARAAAILAGLLATTVGYARGSLSSRRIGSPA
jgi:GT2 family glycosyltransferase